MTRLPLMIILLLSIFYVYSAKTSRIPSYIIFHEEEGVVSELEFQTRLRRLRNTADLYSTYKLFKTQANEMESIYRTLFNEFVDLFQRRYMNVREEEQRFQLFKESLQRHVAMNNKEKELNGTASYGINKFSDWSDEEFHLLLKPIKPLHTYHTINNITVVHQSNSYNNDLMNSPCMIRQTLSNSVDWRGKLTRIKDQKSCGSCWAFVGSEQLETYAAIKGGELVELSPQELLSCSPSLGCEGGNTCGALNWLKQTGRVLVSEKEYPYEEKDTTCRYNQLPHVGVNVKEVCGCIRLVDKEKVMLYALAQKGPLAVNVDSVLWRDYTGGIIQHHCTNLRMNHAVQLVAYYLNDGPVPYYIAKNQWGASWGDNGFVKIKYGGNICGVAEQPSFVEV